MQVEMLMYRRSNVYGWSDISKCQARFGFSHIDDGGLTFKIRRIPQLGESPPWGPVGRRSRVESI